MNYKVSINISLDVSISNIKNNSSKDSIDSYEVKKYLDSILEGQLKNTLQFETQNHFNASKDPSKVLSVQFNSKTSINDITIKEIQ